MDKHKMSTSHGSSKNCEQQKGQKQGSLHIKLENLQNIDDEYRKNPNKKEPEKKATWDNESFTMVDLYEAEHLAQKRLEDTVQQEIKEKTTEEERTTSNEVAKTGDKGKEKENEGYTIVGTGGKVKWEFLITSETMNEEMKKVSTTKLLSAVTKVENN